MGRQAWVTGGISLKKSRLFCLCQANLLSAERAAVQIRRRATNEQGRPLLLDRHLCANRAAQTAGGRAEAEQPCPARQPLVESVHATSFVHAANVAVAFFKGQ